MRPASARMNYCEERIQSRTLEANPNHNLRYVEHYDINSLLTPLDDWSRMETLKKFLKSKTLWWTVAVILVLMILARPTEMGVLFKEIIIGVFRFGAGIITFFAELVTP